MGDDSEEPSDVVIITKVYGDICLRKARRKRQKLLIKEMMLDYADNTTLHGLPYVTRRGLTPIEKVFWIITFIVSVILCLFLISKLWVRWQSSPVIVTVSEQLVPVHMIPFPSVTICPQSKSKVSVYNFTDENIKLGAEFKHKYKYNKSTNEYVLSKDYYEIKKRFKKFNDISEVCNYPGFKIAHSKTETDYSAVNHILEVAPTHADIFMYCYLHGKKLNCSELFSIVLTGEGVCFNMNSLAASEIFRPSLQKYYKYLYTTTASRGWSVKYGYNQSFTAKDPLEDPDYYPVPGAENGDRPDLEVILQDRVAERDNLCNGINSGFKVYIQHPSDLPQCSLYYYAVLNNQLSSMALSFSVLNTSENLKSYDAEIRQCYFPDERYLQYFSIYTASNCRIECLSNITSKICNCVGFHMPYSNNSKLCTEADEKCILRARKILQRQELNKTDIKCDCLPACNSMDYDAEIVKTDFNLKSFLQTYAEAQKFDMTQWKEVNFSKLEMYFKRPRFLSMRRSELFGLVDFLAHCGGLLGLFLGFSFLSLVEIFYFLSLRLCCTIKKDLEEEKAQNDPGTVIHLDKKY